MITKQTAIDIWSCYQEIENSRKLLEDLKVAQAENREPNWRDGFGRNRGLELGVPTDRSSTRLFQVEASLACAVIRSHMAKNEALLVQLNERAVIEASEDPKPIVQEDKPTRVAGQGCEQAEGGREEAANTD